MVTIQGRSEDGHLLIMIETMQRDGQPEEAIHEAVQRATNGDRPERKPHRRQVVDHLRLFRRSTHRSTR